MIYFVKKSIYFNIKNYLNLKKKIFINEKNENIFYDLYFIIQETNIFYLKM